MLASNARVPVPLKDTPVTSQALGQLDRHRGISFAQSEAPHKPVAIDYEPAAVKALLRHLHTAIGRGANPEFKVTAMVGRYGHAYIDGRAHGVRFGNGNFRNEIALLKASDHACTEFNHFSTKF